LGRGEGEGKKQIIPECSITPDALCDLLCRGGALSPPNEGDHRGAPLLFIGDGAIHYKELFRERLGRRFVLAKGKNFPIARDAGLLAMQRFERHDYDDIAALVPNYVRKSDAELRKPI
jgi:hypothetical protein